MVLLCNLASFLIFPLISVTQQPLSFYMWIYSNSYLYSMVLKINPGYTESHPVNG